MTARGAELVGKGGMCGNIRPYIRPYTTPPVSLRSHPVAGLAIRCPVVALSSRVSSTLLLWSSQTTTASALSSVEVAEEGAKRLSQKSHRLRSVYLCFSCLR